jgi:hypothetical protein
MSLLGGRRFGRRRQGKNQQQILLNQTLNQTLN